jgi:outer membrane protein assembly factor BamB
MGGGDETRSSYMEEDINEGNIVGWNLNETPCQTLPLLLNKMVVLALDTSLACVDIETAREVWKTEPLGTPLNLSSTPVLMRPFLFFVTEGNLWKIKPFPNDENPICDVELICEDARIQLANSIPVSIEKEGVKKAFFLLQSNILICELDTKDFSTRLTWIPFEDGLVPRSPIVWNDKLFFTSEKGVVYTVQENRLERLISLGAGDFSAPMLLKAARNSWLVVEGFNNGRHSLFAYNPNDGVRPPFQLEFVVPSYEPERLWMWPIQAGSSHVAVSSHDNSGMYFIDILGNRHSRKDLHTPVRHWQALGSRGGIISIVENRLQSISADDIRPLTDFSFGELRQPIYILANNTHFVLIIGQNLFWKEV